MAANLDEARKVLNDANLADGNWQAAEYAVVDLPVTKAQVVVLAVTAKDSTKKVVVEPVGLERIAP